MTRISRLIPLYCLWFAAGAGVRAATPLPKDPQNVYGRFDNGFSYIIRPHDNPPDRVGLYLHVKSGALNETDSQNGLAHFLEHMAFNGSKNFAPGTLVPYMNKLGMQFGADSNAHTNHHETVFKLFMPDVKPETIDKAMTIFADDAYGLLLTPEEIDKERHVVLEEARARKSAGERMRKEWMRRVFEGTRIALHDVIGDEKQIEHFPRKEFEDYWNTWYRPENMTLIVVGQIKPDDIILAARRHFAEFKTRGPARPATRTGIAPVEKGRAFVLTDPEQVAAQVQMVCIKPARPPIRTFEDYRRSEIEDIGTWIVSRRLREMVQKGSAAFRRARVSVRDIENDAILPGAMASGEPADWNKMLEQTIGEVGRAIDHGFTERELTLARQELLADAERAVKTESTQNARGVINRLSAEVGAESPILSAEQRLELLKKVLGDLSPGEIQEVFVGNFKTPQYTYTLELPEKKEGFSPPSPEDVLAAARAAWARKSEAAQEAKTADSILASPPSPGKVASQETDNDLKVTTLTLENGVVVRHRFVDYKKDEVMVQIALPGGALEETAENRAVSEVAQIAFSEPATSRLDSTQIRDLMTGKNVRVRGDISADACTIMLSGSPKDLESGFQLAYAILTDGRIEPAAFDNWKKRMLQRLEMMKKTPNGRLRQAMDETLYAGDVRLCEPTAEQIGKLDAAQGQAWLRRLTSRAAAEVAIVGDITLADATPLVCRYVGSLPRHSGPADPLSSLRKIKRGPGPYEKTVHFESMTPKAVVLAGCLSCDERDVVDRRLLTMAARILSDRMIRRLREDEQLVYSIQCQNQPARTIPGMGRLFATSTTDPANAEKLAGEVIAMMREFAEKGPTADEVEVARRQTANFLETQMKEPSFWLGQLGEMNYRGRPLAELKELPAVYQTFSAEQIKGVVTKYMAADRVIRFVVIPENKGGKSDGTGEGPKRRRQRQPAGE